MSRFYFLLWARWALRVTLCSVLLASLLSLSITLFVYLVTSPIAYDAKVMSALVDIFYFWFTIVWSATFLLALFRSIKYIFNVCVGGYQLYLLSCDTSEIVERVGYGDLVKVWRKWFMLLIWLVASMIIVSLVFSYTFSIYWLYSFVMLGGYFSFIIMIARCKKVELVKC